MKVGVIGSRYLFIENLGAYLPENTTELYSAGALGTDVAAEKYAKEHNLPYKKFTPDYTYGHSPSSLIPCFNMVDSVDQVVAFWSGFSFNVEAVIGFCEDKKIPVVLYRMDEEYLDEE